MNVVAFERAFIMSTPVSKAGTELLNRHGGVKMASNLEFLFSKFSDSLL